MFQSSSIDISAEQAHALMTDPCRRLEAPVVIDVRTGAEFAERHIPGALNIVLDEILENRIPPELSDPQRLYLLYCRSGRRSGIAARWLAAHGWRRVYNFGGILSWPYETTQPHAGAAAGIGTSPR